MKPLFCSICAAFALTLGGGAFAQDAELPGQAHILAPELTAQALAQCSRVSPTNNGEPWTPSTQQVLEFEDALRETLAKANPELARAQMTEFTSFPDTTLPTEFVHNQVSYVREYVGYQFGDQRLIYGNFVPARLDTGARRPTSICDGGLTFFGVEYDVGLNKVTRIAFNGSVDGPSVAPIEF